MNERDLPRKPGSGGARKGAGRPPKPAHERTQNTERVTAFVTPEEAQQLDELCKLYEMTRADVLRIVLKSLHAAELGVLAKMNKVVKS
jgi:hypothetical protein